MRMILGCIRRADEQFGMIQEGDHVAVGLSGGKDSLVLTYALGLYRKFCKHKFTLEAITLGMGYEGFDHESLARFCESIDVPFTYKLTDIKEVVFDIRKESNPCALCAKLRRGALNSLAHEHGCNKVALGHHREDVLETFLMSLFFESRMHVFAPLTYLERSDVTVIRPMIYAPEAEVIKTARRLQLPVTHNPCPANGKTKRQDMKELLRSFNDIVPDHDAANRMISAMSNIEQYRLWDKLDRKPEE
jgi:tRNA 2-thiocytidine biosynthesis protein TtcA